MTYNSAAYPYRYYPYLQPTPSLGTGSRVAGSISTSTRPKIGGIGRIYNFAKATGQLGPFYKQVIFDVYGVTTNYY
jgi:hypothetical protein